MAAVLAAAVGAVTGVLSGMGIGGGTLLVIYMVNFAHVEQISAQGINLLYFLPVAASSLISHIRNRLIRLRVFVICSVSGVVAAVGGSLLANVLETGVLRKLFGVLLIAAGLAQIFRKKEGKEKERGGEKGRF